LLPSVVCISYLSGAALGEPPGRSPGEEEEEEEEEEEAEEEEEEGEPHTKLAGTEAPNKSSAPERGNFAPFTSSI
jgi:hypothetical protein